MKRLLAERLSLGFALALALALAIPPPAGAQPNSESRAEKLSPSAVAARLLAGTPRSREAVILKKAYDALQKMQFERATSSVASLARGNGVFADYALLVQTQALRGQAERALQTKKFAEAGRLAERALSAAGSIESNYPYSPLIKTIARDLAQAELLAGEASVGRKRWEAAQAYFERGFQRLATASAWPFARVSQIRAYADSCVKKPGELCSAWVRKLANTFPRASEEFKAVTGLFPDAASAPPSFAVGHGTQNYRAPDLDLTAFDTAFASYREGKHRDAISTLERMLDEYPRSVYRFRARYWLAQALKNHHEEDKARRVLEDLHVESPLSYYGMLAAFDLNRPFDDLVDAEGTLEAAWGDEALAPAEQLRLKRARILASHGLRELAAQELVDFRPRDSLSSPFLAAISILDSDLQSHNAAFSNLGTLIQRNYPGVLSEFTLKLVFPSPFLDVIVKEAQAAKLDPILVLSLVKQESAFAEAAVSSSGALGLMQLMPATASDTDPTIARADLVRATANIRVGVRYLRKLLTRFNGNAALALAGYNAGPSAVDRWVRDARASTQILEFIEAIPYKETREYVGSIIRNYFWYSRALNPTESRKSLDYFWAVYGPKEKPGEVIKN